MMRVLSFDVGIFNLAFALVEGGEGPEDAAGGRLLAWDVIALKERGEGARVGFGDLVQRLVRVLRDRFDGERVDVVLIENQPCMKNPTMKSIQVAIHAFFAVRDMRAEESEFGRTEVALVSAASKLQVRERDAVDLSAIVTKSRYARAKKTSVAIARHYLALTADVNASWAPVFEACKKRDDLADVYCQALHYLKR